MCPHEDGIKNSAGKDKFDMGGATKSCYNYKIYYD